MMNKIINGLYIGNIRDAKNYEQLAANSITHILSIMDTENFYQFQNIEYLCICVADSPHHNIINHIPKCNTFIHKARLNNGNVLIHCLAGISRSVTITAAYLSSVTKFNCNETLTLLRILRKNSAPNPGFLKQLIDFDAYCLKQERNRILNDMKLIENDQIEIENLLSSASSK